MIAKKIPMQVLKRSSYVRLIEYLTDQQGKQERVGDIRITHCNSEQAEIAALEVLNTQTQNTRSEADKTYHLLISFRQGEQPDATCLRAIEDRICEALGFSEHQRISVVHHDTDNLHLHVAINKIHPHRHTIHEPHRDFRTLAKICDQLENEFGLQKDNHQPRSKGPANRAADMERHAAVESLLGWIKRNCETQMRGATDWSQLHQVLSEYGLEIRERANGLIIATEDGTAVKASSVAREFSKAKLEARLGTFEPALSMTKPQGKRHYEKAPIRSRIDTTALYTAYKAAIQETAVGRSAELEQAHIRHCRLIERAKRKGRLKRMAIKLLKVPRLAKKVMYSEVGKALLHDIEAINQQYRAERQEIHTRFRRRPWADWLRYQAVNGDDDALAALRARPISTGLAGDTLTGKSASEWSPAHKPDGITKKGTVIYRVGRSAIRDDGRRFQVSRGADHEALMTALKMAMSRYGDCIAVNGSDEFKDRVIRIAVAANLKVQFDDAELEAQRQQLSNSTTKEQKNGREHQRRGPHFGSHARGRGAGAKRAARSATAATTTRPQRREPPAPVRARHDSEAAHSGTALHTELGVGGDQSTAAPLAEDALRGLSARGVDRDAEGPQVLLQGDVPHGLEPEGTNPDPRMRRNLDRTRRVAAASKPGIGQLGKRPPPESKGRLRPISTLKTLGQVQQLPAEGPVHTTSSPQPLPPDRVAPQEKAAGIAAAEIYIAERNQKRTIGFDIPNHSHYTVLGSATLPYAGIRNVEGQALALLRSTDEILVLPVDESTARRLRRLSIGTSVDISSSGIIKRKGRSR